LVPLTYFNAWELALRKMKAKEAARDVIVMASKRFPAHEIFTKQWEGKL
jgi:hypothetical protein